MALGETYKPVKCRQARRVMSLYAKDDPALAPAERQAFEVHLAACPACRREYE